MEIEFEKLNWPKGLGLDLLAPLAQYVPKDIFKRFLVGFARAPRRERRIIFPSQRAIKKVFFHYLWTLIKNGETNWDKIKNDFRQDFRTLKSMDITKFEVERLYEQREKEIKNEQ